MAILTVLTKTSLPLTFMMYKMWVMCLDSEMFCLGEMTTGHHLESLGGLMTKKGFTATPFI